MPDHFTLNQIIATEQASHRYIRVKKIYVDMVNNLQAGMVLSEVFYWHLPNKFGKSRLRTIPNEKEQWLACRRQSWWERSRLTPSQFDNALKKLVQTKLLIKANFDYKGQDTLHVRINWPVFETEYNRALALQTPKAQKRRARMPGIAEMWDILIELAKTEASQINDTKEVSLINDTPSLINDTPSLINESESLNSDTYTTIDTTTDTTQKPQDSFASDDAVSPEPIPSKAVEETPKPQKTDAFKEFVQTLSVESLDEKPKRARKPHPNEPYRNALLGCFGLTPDKVTKTADTSYWKAAAEMKQIGFPLEEIAALHKWCSDQDWPSFTVMAMSKYSGQYLAGLKAAQERKRKQAEQKAALQATASPTPNQLAELEAARQQYRPEWERKTL